MIMLHDLQTGKSVKLSKFQGIFGKPVSRLHCHSSVCTCEAIHEHFVRVLSFLAGDIGANYEWLVHHHSTPA